MKLENQIARPGAAPKTAASDGPGHSGIPGFADVLGDTVPGDNAATGKQQQDPPEAGRSGPAPGPSPAGEIGPQTPPDGSAEPGSAQPLAFLPAPVSVRSAPRAATSAANGRAPADVARVAVSAGSRNPGPVAGPGAPTDKPAFAEAAAGEAAAGTDGESAPGGSLPKMRAAMAPEAERPRETSQDPVAMLVPMVAARPRTDSGPEQRPAVESLPGGGMENLHRNLRRAGALAGRLAGHGKTADLANGQASPAAPRQGGPAADGGATVPQVHAGALRADPARPMAGSAPMRGVQPKWHAGLATREGANRSPLGSSPEAPPYALPASGGDVRSAQRGPASGDRAERHAGLAREPHLRAIRPATKNSAHSPAGDGAASRGPAFAEGGRPERTAPDPAGRPDKLQSERQRQADGGLRPDQRGNAPAPSPAAGPLPARPAAALHKAETARTTLVPPGPIGKSAGVAGSPKPGLIAGATGSAAVPAPEPAQTNAVATAPPGAASGRGGAASNTARMSTVAERPAPLSDDPRNGETGDDIIADAPVPAHTGATQGHAPASLSQTNGRHILANFPRVASQIADAAMALQNGPVEIMLKPESLGRVRLSLHARDDGTMAVLVAADRAETGDLLRRNIEQLATELRDAGFRDVSFSFEQRHPQSPQQMARNDNDAGVSGAGSFEHDHAPVAPGQNRSKVLWIDPDAGIDLRL